MVVTVRDLIMLREKDDKTCHVCFIAELSYNDAISLYFCKSDGQNTPILMHEASHSRFALHLGKYAAPLSQCAVRQLHPLVPSLHFYSSDKGWGMPEDFEVGKDKTDIETLFKHLGSG